MAKGGNQVQKSEVTQSNLPEYARPYFENLMGGAQGLLSQEYTPYGGQRIADFTPQQRAVQTEAAGMQTPGQFGYGSQLATAAGLGSLQAGQYDPGQFYAQQIRQPSLQQYSMGAPQQVQGGQYGSPQMGAAQTGFQPNLQQYEMGGARDVAGMGVEAPTMEAAQTGYGQGPLEQFRTEAPQAFGLEQARQYMSPYAEAVLEPQKREAIRSAKQAQIVQDLGAARQGTYGGSRQLLAGMERERNLGQQLGDIEAKGLQSAYESAQQQFERDRTAGMTAGQQNLQAALQQQQLGVSTGMQAALANLDSASQANVQNLAAQLQTQGLNAEQALRAALANQQAGLTTGQQNLEAALQTQQLGAQTGLAALQSNQQAALEAQKLREQSRQFGAGQQLAGYAQAGQMAQTLGNLGQYQQQADLSRMGYQGQAAAQEQAMRQQYLDTAYQDFLRQRDYQAEQLQQYSSLLRGVPVTPSTTATTYAQAPGIGQQLLGTGLGAASIYKTFGGA